MTGDAISSTTMPYQLARVFAVVERAAICALANQSESKNDSGPDGGKAGDVVAEPVPAGDPEPDAGGAQ